MEKWVIRRNRPAYPFLAARYYLFRKPVALACLRPLPALAAASAAGVISSVLTIRFWFVPLIFILLFWFCRWRAQLQKRWMTLALPVLFVWSAMHTALILLPAEKFAGQMADHSFTIQGKVCSLVWHADQSDLVMIRLPNSVKVVLAGKTAGLKYGQEISASVIGQLPSGGRNPGGFDEAAWLAAQGIFLKVRTEPGTSYQLIREKSDSSLILLGLRIRQAVIQFSAGLLKPDENALLSGLLFGDTSLITPALRLNFQKAGLAHLMSVSGSNVSFLIFPLGCLLRKSTLGRKSRLWMLLGVLISFGFLTGWQISVTRAILMAGSDLAGRIMHRSSDAISSLSLAALLLLLLQPMTALAAGFWLSLTAAASLLLFAGPMADQLKKRLPFLPLSLAEALATVICVHLCLLPILAQVSHEISLIGLAANLPAVPLAGWITLTAAVALPIEWLISLLPMPGFLASVVIRPLAFSLKLLAGLACQAGRILPGHLFKNRLNPAFWLAWMLFLIVAISSWQRQPVKLRRLIRLAGYMRLPAIAAWILLDLLSGICQPATEVWFLDVGQGDAILIRAKSGETLLIDGGKPGSGYSVLIPAMDALGFNQIDLAIVTHGHADHAGGVMELISAGRVSALAISGEAARMAVQAPKGDLTDELLEIAGQSGIKVSELFRNDTIVLGPQIKLRALAPFAGQIGEQTGQYDANDCSLIMQADLSGFRILFAADCTRQTEERLLAASDWQAAEILKVAHHGSRMTTSEKFLSAVRPAAAIVSVGPNYYGHPSADVLRQLQSAGSQVFRTDQFGAAKLEISQNGWKISTILSGQTAENDYCNG